MQFSHLFMTNAWLEPLADACHNTAKVDGALSLQANALESTVAPTHEPAGSANLLAVP